MKIIILCAGTSSRTKLGYPKCLYKFKDGEMLIEKNINKFKAFGFKNNDFIFATGFKSQLVKKKTKNLFKYFKNKKFKTTNMVYSLNTVLKKIKYDDIIILYSDILFEKKCLNQIIKDKREISTLVDIDWIPKWIKKKNYLEDLEEMKIQGSKIKFLGKKVFSIKGIDGRFIGITKFSKNYVKFLYKNRIIDKLLKINKKIDFTNFLMSLIENKQIINVIKGKFDWTEFDTYEDFKIYESKLKK